MHDEKLENIRKRLSRIERLCRKYITKALNA